MTNYPLVRPGEEYPNYSSFSCIRTANPHEYYVKSPFYSFKDFNFNDENKKNHLKGTWFLMPSADHYHHFLKEMLGPYLYYKNNIDDSIKVLWIDVPVHPQNPHKMQLVNSEIKQLLSEFEIETFNCENISVSVDELITFAVGPRFLPIPNFIKHYVFCNTSYYHFPEVNNELRKFFTPYMIEDKTKPKKIFISRKESNISLEENNLKNHRYENSDFLQALEDYYNEQEYTILSLSGMSIFEQISYFYNAEKIAGSPGTNLCNVIFSKPDVSLTEIIHFDDYYYPWHIEFDSVIPIKYQDINVVGCSGYNDTINILKESGEK